MKARSLQTRINKLIELNHQLDSKEYKCERDEKSNLIIKFMDNTQVKLPLIPFRPYQLEIQKSLYVDGFKRFFLVRPRRSGKEVESWNLLLQGAIENPGLYLMIYPTNVRARIVLWDGAISLPKNKSLKFIDMIPKRFVLSLNNQDMSIKLLNGSVIRVIGSDIDPDKLRGVNVRGAVFSEYAFSDPRVLHILMPVFRQNEGWFILQTTFNGMNHAYRFIQDVKNDKDWVCRVDSVESLIDEHGKRYVTDDMINADRRSGMPEFMIQQEYYSVVQINQEKLYFANEINNINEQKRIIPGLIIPDKRVNAFMDIGWNDQTAILLVQTSPLGDPHIISYMENNNKIFEFYVQWAESFCIKNGLILDKIYSPHDGKKHDFGSGKNIIDFGRDLGYLVRIVPKPTSKINAIQSMRKLLYRTYFNKENTERLIDCLSNYEKEYDLKGGRYKDNPNHNWATHGVDAYQTLALALEGKMLNEKVHDLIYYSQ